MKPDRWRQIDELFEAALERPAKERAEFLDQACGGDAELRREVEKMLKFDARAADFIETDVFELAAGLMTAGARESSQAHAPLQKKKPAKQSLASFPSDSIDDARFVPGDILLDRYRIVGLLGRGGMGEVYRADDLKLKQAVALKFLPESLSANGGALARFYKEVSVARQISHRHVCRVYDVGEFEGQHFISMEFVRGEELSSLLKRIGRLPQDKALEIARQLCAGVAAVHERGVLHRDLKPANIMIDDHGDVRITDFGIAALAEEVRGPDAMSGTPAYMSPEQLEGQELTVKSDIYSLGLVLYEVFTGKKAFEASSLPELLRLRRSGPTPTSPAQIVPDLDPVVERVIFRCLERDPSKRPASTLQVAAALPGGDPLAAALAAGETPSPEMVAAAPKEGVLRPAVAVSLLASFIVMMGILCFGSKSMALYRLVPLEKSPEVLRDRATEIVKKLGYPEQAADSAYGIQVDRPYLEFIQASDSSPSRWEKIGSGQPAALYFWYRQSPRPFQVWNTGDVSESSPAQNLPGMKTLTLDTLGRLRSFAAVPPQISTSPAVAAPPDWSVLFSETGLDLTKLQPVPSTWTPPHGSTVRAAWEGSYPNQPALKIHVEAAMNEGKPVYFEIIDAWDKPKEQSTTGVLRDRTLGVIILTVFVMVMIGSAFLAWRNLRLGRGDRKGAFRLAAFVFATMFLRWVFTTHHVLTEDEARMFLSGMQSVLFWSAFFWVVYVAFEPFVRRHWPERIISWNRLLAGGFRDPLVGRDLLIGAVFGAGLIMFNSYFTQIVPKWLGYVPPAPWFEDGATQLLGIRSFPGAFTFQIFASLMQPFIVLFVLLLLYIILRFVALAALALWLILSAALILAHETSWGTPFAFVGAFLIVWVLYRYGLWALISALFVLHLGIFYPITSDFSAWYGADFGLALLISLALAVYGFYISLAGQPLFRPFQDHPGHEAF